MYLPPGETLLSIIDTATFSSLWYWLAYGTAWAMTTHWVMGAPFDLIWSARRGQDNARADLDAVVDVHTRRLIHFARLGGHWIVGLLGFLLTLLGTLGFYYGSELARGLFFLLTPLALTWAMSFRFAARLHRTPLAGEALAGALLKLRLKFQVIAMLSIFVTAAYSTFILLEAYYIP